MESLTSGLKSTLLKNVNWVEVEVRIKVEIKIKVRLRVIASYEANLAHLEIASCLLLAIMAVLIDVRTADLRSF
ncbi:MAG: hypothetical protein REI64_10905 [Pedobacter sp.]|uniref:hypothetical protein n=1 Tax=Pedobacter sp. TaxID=1411316 RepID=UPI00280860B2|nr:hypothetical protein [Pedobacter sp.]MDQ8005300.1 hypothetical protein [Pedobacter sp.]